MIPEINYSLPKYYSSKAIAAFFISLIACNMLFFHKMLPFEWMISATIEAVCFLYFTQTLSKQWIRYSEKKFTKKLFSTALVLKIAWVIFAYFFYTWMNGEPFEFASADSHFYYNSSQEFAQYIRDGNFTPLWDHPTIDASDMGFAMWLSLLNLLFGDSLIIPRLIHAVLSAYTCVLLYRITTRNFGEAAGRLAGIMCMLLPNFFFYVGIHLKETFMIFLMVYYADNADQLLRSTKFTVKSILFTLLGGVLLFFFRTVLGVVAIFSLFTALVFTKGRNMKKWGKRIVIAVWIGFAIGAVASSRVISEIEILYKNNDSNQQTGMQFRATQEGGNPFAKYGSMAVFAPMIITLPFPSFTVALAEQQNQMMFSGGYFVRNVYSFFVLLALLLLIKRHEWREHLFIITFFISYLLIIAKSSFAVSERFHLPAVPFMLAMAAYGITRAGKKERKWFVPYLIFIVFVVIGWNWFKLAGRGLA
jgi:hypothetical protein